MAEKCLALYLDGPLQSWGYQSRFDRRTTLSFPTRSGILGMLCAAMGVDRADQNGLRRLDDLKLTVLCFGDSGRLVDYHTVGGGYDKKIHPQNIVRTAEGKTGKTVLTYRHYLQDARFGVMLWGESSLLSEIATALQNPRWGIWLGRKSCIPASPVLQGLFKEEAEAKARLEQLANCKTLRIIREVSGFAHGTDTLLDRPLDFAQRHFAPRQIDDSPVTPEDKE
jgi:CRISPR system Cascade subunit CasD